MQDAKLTNDLIKHAMDMGIDIVGITDVLPIKTETYAYSDYDIYRCGGGRHKTEVKHDLFDPLQVIPDAKAIIISGLYTYGYEEIIESTDECPRGKIGPWTRLYPYICKSVSSVFVDFLESRGYTAEYTNDLPNRALALKAGIGKLGRNHFVYTKKFGSYIRITCTVTNAPLKTESHNYDFSKNNCGKCTLCVDSCPTGSIKLDGSYNFDTCLHQVLQGKCYEGETIPLEYRDKTEKYLMRTGKCLEICPKNRRLVPRDKLPEFLYFPDFDKPDSPPLLPIVNASDEQMDKMLPMAVTKYGKNNVRQNAIVALGENGNEKALPELALCLFEKESQYARLAAWSLGKIGGQNAEEILMKALKKRSESIIKDEIIDALKMINTD